MSLDLKDVRVKLDPVDKCWLDAYASVRQVDVSRVVRELVHDWVSKQRVTATVAQKNVEIQGMLGNLGEGEA